MTCYTAICVVGQLPYMAGTAGLWYDIVSSRRRHGRVRFQRFDPRSVRAGFYGGFAQMQDKHNSNGFYDLYHNPFTGNSEPRGYTYVAGYGFSPPPPGRL